MRTFIKHFIFLIALQVNVVTAQTNFPCVENPITTSLEFTEDELNQSDQSLKTLINQKVVNGIQKKLHGTIQTEQERKNVKTQHENYARCVNGLIDGRKNELSKLFNTYLAPLSRLKSLEEERRNLDSLKKRLDVLQKEFVSNLLNNKIYGAYAFIMPHDITQNESWHVDQALNSQTGVIAKTLRGAFLSVSAKVVDNSTISTIVEETINVGVQIPDKKLKPLSFTNYGTDYYLFIEMVEGRQRAGNVLNADGNFGIGNRQNVEIIYLNDERGIIQLESRMQDLGFPDNIRNSWSQNAIALKLEAIEKDKNLGGQMSTLKSNFESSIQILKADIQAKERAITILENDLKNLKTSFKNEFLLANTSSLNEMETFLRNKLNEINVQIQALVEKRITTKANRTITDDGQNALANKITEDIFSIINSMKKDGGEEVVYDSYLRVENGKTVSYERKQQLLQTGSMSKFWFVLERIPFTSEYRADGYAMFKLKALGIKEEPKKMDQSPDKGYEMPKPYIPPKNSIRNSSQINSIQGNVRSIGGKAISKALIVYASLDRRNSGVVYSDENGDFTINSYFKVDGISVSADGHFNKIILDPSSSEFVELEPDGIDPLLGLALNLNSSFGRFGPGFGFRFQGEGTFLPGIKFNLNHDFKSNTRFSMDFHIINSWEDMLKDWYAEGIVARFTRGNNIETRWWYGLRREILLADGFYFGPTLGLFNLQNSKDAYQVIGPYFDAKSNKLMFGTNLWLRWGKGFYSQYSFRFAGNSIYHYGLATLNFSTMLSGQLAYEYLGGSNLIIGLVFKPHM